MARIRVHIPRSTLAYHPHLHAEETVEVREGETLLDVVHRLGLNQLEFGIAVVKGERELMTYQPRDGEEIELLPIIHGGAPAPAPAGGGVPGSPFTVHGSTKRESPTANREP